MTEYDERESFFESYQPTWKLHQFAHPVWLVEYIFDEDGPSEAEFEVVFELVGPYLKLTREEFVFRMDGCCGFSPGQPCSTAQLQTLLGAGIRIESTEIYPSEHLVYLGDGKYLLIQDPALREELAAWMVSQGAEVEIVSIE